MSKLSDVLARLPEIKTRAEKATPGPWRKHMYRRGHEGTGTLIGAVAPGHQIRTVEEVGSYPSRDQDFIAAARADVPSLVEALEEARDLLTRYHAEWGCLYEVPSDNEHCSEYPCKVREALGR